MSGLMLFGLAVFLFLFGILPYWFKVHKHLSEILGCEYPRSFVNADADNGPFRQAGR